MKSVGFKEWAIVCQALGEGQQSVIIRKGGIAEGRDGFAFRNREFFLFPTFFHEQVDKTRLRDASIPRPNESQVEIQFFARIEHACRIESWETVTALESFHVLKQSVVRERFDDVRALGIHAAFVRVFCLGQSWVLPNDKRYAGCRSWVELPKPPATIRLEPVLGEEEHVEMEKRFLSVIGPETMVSKSVAAAWRPPLLEA
jgi:hypothetical protein